MFPTWCSEENYLSLATFRRDGREVRTPVWFALSDDAQGQCLYVFSAPEVGKVKRLRRSSRARIAACDVRGKLNSDFSQVAGFLLNDANDITKARAALRSKYGWQMRLTDFFSGLTGRLHRRQYLVIRPLAPHPSARSSAGS